MNPVSTSWSRLAGARRGVAAATGAICALAFSLGAIAEQGAEAPASGGSGVDLLGGPPTTLPYLREYPAVHYEQMPADNVVAALQRRLERGEIKLEFRPPRGYLEAVLAALEIDPSSQVLVYSKTSLQVAGIGAATPRAIYFNERSYVAWVQGSANIEVAAMDAKLGQVFYVLPNRSGVSPRLQRLTLDCLSCHDTYELSGGGVPRFLLMSTYVDVHGSPLSHEGQILTSDQTELKYRWGGWYVTGRSGSQVHLGNIQVHDAQELVHLDEVRRGNLDSLAGLFDTHPYLTDQSDIVALLVLQHQVDVQNLITRVSFEVQTALANERHAAKRSAAAVPELPEKVRAQLRTFMDQLVDAMLFIDAARFTAPISGRSGFDRWFQARGARDPSGRSLRDLDLRTRLFKYPLSYLIYSVEFDALPEYAKHYVFERLAQILNGGDHGEAYAQLAPEDRKAIIEILRATKPDFTRFLTGQEAASARGQMPLLEPPG